MVEGQGYKGVAGTQDGYGYSRGTGQRPVGEGHTVGWEKDHMDASEGALDSAASEQKCALAEQHTA